MTYKPSTGPLRHERGDDGLTARQHVVLAKLRENPGISLREMARRACVSVPSIYDRLQGLERLGRAHRAKGAYVARTWRAGRSVPRVEALVW